MTRLMYLSNEIDLDKDDYKHTSKEGIFMVMGGCSSVSVDVVLNPTDIGWCTYFVCEGCRSRANQQLPRFVTIGWGSVEKNVPRYELYRQLLGCNVPKANRN